METNFAVNIYNGNHNFDVDLAGPVNLFLLL